MVDMQERDQKKKDDNLPPGFRFHPTDEELITYYLMNKISDSNFTGRAIGDVDLNKCEPWDLPGITTTKLLLRNPKSFWSPKDLCRSHVYLR